jgi:hypothetical protein
MATEHEHESGTIRRPDQAKERRLEKVDDPGRGEYGQAPNLSARVVVGVFDRLHEAQDGVRGLRAAGLPESDISLVSPPPGSAPETSADETEANAGGATGVAAGAVAGAALAGLVTLAIPGVGALLAIGPLAAALGGAAVGGALGGLIGSLSGLGIPTEEAREYEAAVRSGSTIVTVKAGDSELATNAERVLGEQGARQVHSYQEVL